MKTREQILINASTNIMGGGLIVAVDFIHQLISMDIYDIALICPQIRSFSIFRNQCNMIFVPKFSLLKPFRWFLDYYWLPGKISKINPSLIISLTNLPAITGKRQIFVHDNPFITNSGLTEIPLSRYNKVLNFYRKILFLSRVKYVDLFVAQTRFEKQKLQNVIHDSTPVKVLEPFIPTHLKLQQANHRIKNYTKNGIKLICPSWYYKHKNLEIFISAAEIAIQRNLHIQFYLTINENQNNEAKRFIRSTNKYKETIINLGYQDPENMQNLLLKFDGVILPSLLETYGLNCIDAWVCNKPLFISDLPFARANCKNAAFYFDPYNAQNILESIMNAFQDNLVLQEVINHGSNRLKTLSNSTNLKNILEE